MLTNVVLLAGAGQRFKDAGYEDPKPFIPVMGRPMIEHAVAGLPDADLWVFVCQSPLLMRLSEWIGLCFTPSHPSARHGIVHLREQTAGPMFSLLAAEHAVPADSQLIVADCDQRTRWSPNVFLAFCTATQAEMAFPVFHDDSFDVSRALLDENWRVLQMVGKGPGARSMAWYADTNNMAVNGVRYFREAQAAFRAIREHTGPDAQSLAPQHGEANLDQIAADWICAGRRVLAYPVNFVQMMGTPSQVEALNAKYHGAACK